MRSVRAILVLGLLLLATTVAHAQKQGGIVRVYHRDFPGGMSIHELGTISAIMVNSTFNGWRMENVWLDR